MFKFIIILVLLLYILNKVSVLIFRVAGHKQTPPNFRRPADFRRPDDGKININTPPKKSKSNLKGGEYVDYEEVK